MALTIGERMTPTKRRVLAVACFAAITALWMVGVPRLLDVAGLRTPQQPMDPPTCFSNVEMIWLYESWGYRQYSGDLVDRLRGTTWTEMADIADEVCA